MRTYVQDTASIVEEPSLVATDTRSGSVLAIGRMALSMVGRVPGYVQVASVLEGGSLGDTKRASQVIQALIEATLGGTVARPHVAFCLSCDAGELEQSTAKQAARKAGAATVTLLARPMAAAVGASLAPLEPLGKMLVDLGASSTEAAVVCLGTVVTRRVSPVGGVDLDRCIAEHLRTAYGLVVTQWTAQELKKALGTAPLGSGSAVQKAPGGSNIAVQGRRVDNAKPLEVAVSADEINLAMVDSLRRIAMVVSECLLAAPGDLAEDLLVGGVHLVGGGAHLPGMAEWVSAYCSMPVKLVDDPATAAVRGAARCMEGSDGCDGLRPMDLD